MALGKMEKLTNGTTRQEGEQNINDTIADSLGKHRCCIGQIDKNPFCGLPTF